MTYCVAVKLDAGLVFLSDSRTNAGVDQISTYRKMIIYERSADRFMVMLSAGNLSISQSVRELLQVEKIDNGPSDPPLTIWNAPSMFDAARVLGATVRRVYAEDAASLKNAGVEFNISMILGGQIVCIDDQNPYFQMIRSTWGQRLRQVFESIEDPQWTGGATQNPLCVGSARYEPMRKITHPCEKII